MEFNRAYPDPGPVDVAELLASADLPGLASAERPYTLVNFVASADGRVTFQGRSGQLGDEGDRHLFHSLREHVDAVMAGTGTLRIERYGRLARDPERRARRVRAGLEPEPVAAVLTRSGDVPVDIPLFAEPEARAIVFTPVPVDVSQAAARIEVVLLDPGEATMTTMMRRLRADYGVRTLLCEGGPTVFGALLQEDLVDELYMTLAAKLVGGGNGPTLTTGPELAQLQALELAWALERHGSLYLRYRLTR